MGRDGIKLSVDITDARSNASSATSGQVPPAPFAPGDQLAEQGERAPMALGRRPIAPPKPPPRRWPLVVLAVGGLAAVLAAVAVVGRGENMNDAMPSAISSELARAGGNGASVDGGDGDDSTEGAALAGPAASNANGSTGTTPNDDGSTATSTDRTDDGSRDGDDTTTTNSATGPTAGSVTPSAPTPSAGTGPATTASTTPGSTGSTPSVTPSPTTPTTPTTAQPPSLAALGGLWVGTFSGGIGHWQIDVTIGAGGQASAVVGIGPIGGANTFYRAQGQATAGGGQPQLSLDGTTLISPGTNGFCLAHIELTMVAGDRLSGRWSGLPGVTDGCPADRSGTLNVSRT